MDKQYKDWDCPMKDLCYGCIPAVQFKMDNTTDAKEQMRLSGCIEYLRTHKQVAPYGEWVAIDGS